MTEKPAKPETGRNSANLIAHNKESPFQILDVRSLTSSIDDEVGALNIGDAKIPNENEDTDAEETAPEEEDGAEEDTGAEKDETVQKTTVQNATTTEQESRKEGTATEDESAVGQDDTGVLTVTAVVDKATIEKDAVATVAAKTKEQLHYSARMSDIDYSTDEERNLVIDMSFEDEESPKKGKRTNSNKDDAGNVTEETDKKTSEHSNPISSSGAEPITLSNESGDDEESVTRKEATQKVKPKAGQVSEVDAGGDDDEDEDDDDDDDSVEFVEETNEVRDVEGQPIKEEEDEMDLMEISSQMRTLISMISGLRVASNELLDRHHTLQIDFANTAADTRNYEDCLKWAQAYLRGSG